MSEQQKQQNVITLNTNNSVEILSQYISMAQEKGAFLLAESDILKRCRDFLLKNIQDSEINVPTAKNLLIQGIIKGQGKGCFNLDDASILHKVCGYVSTNLDEPMSLQQVTPQSSVSSVSSISSVSSDDDSLSMLSDPVPLKNSGPRTV